MKQDFCLFREAGGAVVKSEMTQLHEWDVMKPIGGKKLTKEQRNEVLAYLMFFKQKTCGHDKARGCADGRKQ